MDGDDDNHNDAGNIYNQDDDINQDDGNDN